MWLVYLEEKWRSKNRRRGGTGYVLVTLLYRERRSDKVFVFIQVHLDTLIQELHMNVAKG